jgi:hypothetical protein
MVVTGAIVLPVMLTACGGSISGAAPAASSTADLPQFITCLQGHGVGVSSSIDVNAVRTALQNAGKTQKKSAMAACRQYDGGLGGKSKNKNKG